MGRDRIVVDVGAAGVAWRAEIDLSAGTMTRSGTSRDGVTVIADEDLASLQLCLEQAHALGNCHVREQFADGCVTFELTKGGETVERIFETWGGSHYEGLEAIWAFTVAPQRTSS